MTDDSQRNGQAIVELIAGLVAILILLAFLLQMTSVTRAHTGVVLKARYEGGMRAQEPLPFTAAPDYIEDWEPGPDEKRYTADDENTFGDASRFSKDLVAYAASDRTGWNVLDSVSNDALPALRGSVNPAALFGLIGHEESETVRILPAVRSLLYRADQLDIKYEVWTTHSRVD